MPFLWGKYAYRAVPGWNAMDVPKLFPTVSIVENLYTHICLGRNGGIVDFLLYPGPSRNSPIRRRNCDVVPNCSDTHGGIQCCDGAAA